MSAATGVSAKTYLAVWGWLAGLMLISVLLSGLPMSARAVAWLVLGVSSVKAALVTMYYMHLKFDRRWLLVVAGFPLALIILVVGLLYSRAACPPLMPVAL